MAAIVAYLVLAPKAHAETTQAINDGNVEIEQSISPTANDSTLFPAVYSAEVSMTMPYQGLDGIRTWDPSKVNNAVDYQVSVTNEGTLKAYVRTVIALEESSKRADVLTFLNDNTQDFSWSKVPSVVQLGDAKFVIYVAVCNEPLSVGQSVEVVSQIAMNKDVDNTDIEPLGDKYNIKVMTQAALYDSGLSANDLLNAKFGAITAESHPWSQKKPTSASSQAAA